MWGATSQVNHPKFAFFTFHSQFIHSTMIYNWSVIGRRAFLVVLPLGSTLSSGPWYLVFHQSTSFWFHWCCHFDFCFFFLSVFLCIIEFQFVFWICNNCCNNTVSWFNNVHNCIWAICCICGIENDISLFVVGFLPTLCLVLLLPSLLDVSFSWVDLLSISIRWFDQYHGCASIMMFSLSVVHQSGFLM